MNSKQPRKGTEDTTGTKSIGTGRMKRVLIYSSLCLSICISTAKAVPVVSGAAAWEGQLSSGTDLNLGQKESSSEVFVFKEKNLVLGAALTVDAGGPIAAGTAVESYLVHFDPTGAPLNPVILGGTVQFDGAILGLIYADALLNSTDGLLGVTGVAYPSGGRGSVLGGDFTDVVSFTGNTLTFSLQARPALDQVRIVTIASAVPEGGDTLLLLMLASVGLWSATLARRQ